MDFLRALNPIRKATANVLEIIPSREKRRRNQRNRHCFKVVFFAVMSAYKQRGRFFIASGERERERTDAVPQLVDSSRLVKVADRDGIRALKRHVALILDFAAQLTPRLHPLERFMIGTLIDTPDGDILSLWKALVPFMDCPIQKLFVTFQPTIRYILLDGQQALFCLIIEQIDPA